jgi:hypothetical protein
VFAGQRQQRNWKHSPTAATGCPTRYRVRNDSHTSGERRKMNVAGSFEESITFVAACSRGPRREARSCLDALAPSWARTCASAYLKATLASRASLSGRTIEIHGGGADARPRSFVRESFSGSVIVIVNSSNRTRALSRRRERSA